MQFNQLPSKVQELLVKQLKQSGQGLQQLQQSKFLLLNAQQATTTTTTGSSSSSSFSGIKLHQKGEVQTGSPSKQVTKITVKQTTGAVQPSSTSKQVTKNIVQIPAKQATTTAEQPPSQQKNGGHIHQSYDKPPPQGVCLTDTANTKRIEINKQQPKRDDEPHPQSKHKQLPPKHNMSQDSVDEEDEEDAMSEQKKKAETLPIMESPVQKEADAVEAFTRAVKKEVDIVLCFVCLEERYVVISSYVASVTYVKGK